MDEQPIARGLGWFSLGLAFAEESAPDQLARLIGVSDACRRARTDERTRAILRAVGIREAVSGIGILAQARPVGWLWARVAGDVMDLALLGVALTRKPARPERVAAALSAVAGITVLDVWTSLRMTSRAKERALQTENVITINRSPQELYRYWHDFENLPTFMRHLESVRVTGGGRSHWQATAPAGAKVEWDAEITDDRANELIAWRSLPDAAVRNIGSVRFTPAPRGRGTEVRVTLRYEPPGGKLGATIAKLFGEEPGQQVLDDLRHFKQVMETGEVTRSEASVRGGRPGGGPAQPLAETPPPPRIRETGQRPSATAGSRG
jgi:uncharacterized membrane protein